MFKGIINSDVCWFQVYIACSLNMYSYILNNDRSSRT